MAESIELNICRGAKRDERAGEKQKARKGRRKTETGEDKEGNGRLGKKKKHGEGGVIKFVKGSKVEMDGDNVKKGGSSTNGDRNRGLHGPGTIFFRKK